MLEAGDFKKPIRSRKQKSLNFPRILIKDSRVILPLISFRQMGVVLFDYDVIACW